jgi:hypothetical protein
VKKHFFLSPFPLHSFEEVSLGLRGNKVWLLGLKQKQKKRSNLDDDFTLADVSFRGNLRAEEFPDENKH